MTTKKSNLTIIDGQRLVAEFYKSELKAAEFCIQKNIPYHVLQYWKERCKVLNGAPIVNKAKFVPINLLESTIKTSAVIKIKVNAKITIELPHEVNASQFKQILEVCVACG